MSSFCKSKAGRWKRYNAWRSENRELDRTRRLERAEEKATAYIENYVDPKITTPRQPKAHAHVRIHFSDGTSASFSIRQLPGRLTISPTSAGKRVALLIANYKPKNSV